MLRVYAFFVLFDLADIAANGDFGELTKVAKGKLKLLIYSMLQLIYQNHESCRHEFVSGKNFFTEVDIDSIFDYIVDIDHCCDLESTTIKSSTMSVPVAPVSFTIVIDSSLSLPRHLTLMYSASIHALTPFPAATGVEIAILTAFGVSPLSVSLCNL